MNEQRVREWVFDDARRLVDVAARSSSLAMRVGDVARRFFNHAQPFVAVA